MTQTEPQTPKPLDEARRKILIDLVLISMTLVAIISIFPYGETENGLPLPPAREGLTTEAIVRTSRPRTGDAAQSDSSETSAAVNSAAAGPSYPSETNAAVTTPVTNVTVRTSETTVTVGTSDTAGLPVTSNGDAGTSTPAKPVQADKHEPETTGKANPVTSVIAETPVEAAKPQEGNFHLNEALTGEEISTAQEPTDKVLTAEAMVITGKDGAALPGADAIAVAGVDKKKGSTIDGPTIIEGIRAFPESLNPLLARDSESLKVTSMVYSGLLAYGKDLFLRGDLAEAWEISEDRRKVKFTLRPARWHDGSEVTALDVKATFDYIWKHRDRCPRAEDFSQVAQVVAMDGRTVRVEYRKAFARLVDIWTIPILRAGSIPEATSQNHDIKSLPIGSGPYVPTAVKFPSGISLEAFEGYHFGPPEIKKYEFKVLQGDEKTIEALAKGEVDMVEIPFGLQVRQGLGGSVVESFPSNDCEWLIFNTGNQKLADRDLRQCLSMAIDTQAITSTVPGGATRLTGPFLSTSWATDPAIQPQVSSPEKARERLASLERPLPAEITILTDSGNSWRVSAARKIAAAWRTLGIQVSVSPIPWNMLVTRVTSRNYEAALIGFELDVDPDPFSLWHSSSTIGGLNITGFASPEADQLIEKGRECFLTDERQEAYRALHRLILDDAPCVFLFSPARRICLGPKLKTAIFTRTGTRVDAHKWTSATREGGAD